MKAKLVKHESKHESGYILFDEKGIPIGAIPNVLSNGTFSKLSFKNCQAIERGYDLDELATKICGNNIYDFEKHDFFRQGFQEALELMGDKKFSASQLLNAMDLVWQWINGEDYGCKTLTEVQDKHIQSLQQTEWEVEIEMEEIQEIYRDGTTKYERVPKLDADGCLILKRI